MQPPSKPGWERRHLSEPQTTATANYSTAAASRHVSSVYGVAPSDTVASRCYNEAETAGVVAAAVDELVPLVEQYHRPGQTLSFQFLSRARETLERVVAQPLTRRHGDGKAILQTDLRRATRLLEEKEQETRMLLATTKTDIAAIQALIDSPPDAPMQPITAEGHPGAAKSPVVIALQQHVRQLKQTIADTTQAIGKRDETIANYKARHITFTSEVKQLKQLASNTTEADNAKMKLEAENHNQQAELDKLREEVQALRAAHGDLSAKASEASSIPQMRALAAMLQESHRSLASTNEHLLKQLEDERFKHTKELEQLRWNYDELKRTADRLAASNTDLGLSMEVETNA